MSDPVPTPPSGLRDIRLFVLYRVVSRLYFHLPVLFLHLYLVELGLYRVIALLAIYGLVTTVTSGLGGKLLGVMSEKKVVAAGETMKACGIVLLLAGTRLADVDMNLLVFAQIVGGTGFSVALSTDSSLLRTLAGAAGDATLFMRTQTRSQSQMFIATLVAGSTGSILFDYQPFWPFYASLAASIVSTLLVLMIHEPRAESRAATGASTDAPVLDPTQRFWMGFYSLSRAFTLAPFVGFLPFYFIMVDVDPLLFGAVLGLFTLSAFATSLTVNGFIARFGVKALMIATLACMFSSMLVLGCSDILAYHGIDYFVSGLIGISLLGLGSGGVRPATMANLDMSALDPLARVAMFARMERNFGVANGILLAIGAYLLADAGFQALMLWLSGLYLLALGALFYANRTVKPNEATP
ncbi:MFS transporter [Burkholderia contaminans]|uniref:MFS transporter n=1 Tax=Burkholderia contaminans TaxID=488447 RepID=UPI000F57E842|nr:MFS transporter [Burkholderia contaminans]RQT02064.1 MFS transporter [Burkholderia contaminans]